MKQVGKFTNRGGTQARYPWAQIAEAGDVWQLRSGEDYTVGDASLRNAAYEWAKRHGVTAHVSVPEPGVVEVIFVPQAVASNDRDD